MKVIIDRIEGNIAVVEKDETVYHLPTALCPGAKEGDTIEITVIGKQQSKEGTRAIFERLRKNNRPKTGTQDSSENGTPTEAPDSPAKDKNAR